MFLNPKQAVANSDVYPSQIVVDFGAGVGHHVFELSDCVGPTGKVYAVDIQKDLLLKIRQEAEKKGKKNIEIVWADLEESKGSTLADNLADRVIVSNVIFQIENKKVFAEEIKRILKPKGKVCVFDWTDSFGGLGPKKEDVFSEISTKRLFEDVGFKFEKSVFGGDHHYGIILIKQ